MATCRICRSVYPEEHFITGNGPRYLVCARCGVKHGYATADETPQLYSDALVKQRMTVLGRRFAPLFWVVVGWSLWTLFFAGIPLWGRASLVVMVVATLAAPIQYILGGPKYRAQMAKLTPE